MQQVLPLLCFSTKLKTKALFAIASMNIRCWNSNSDDFRKTVPKEDLDKRDILKILGLLWNRLTDTLAIPVPDRQQLMLAKTKREVLHGVAAIYDPLGLFSPVTISGKLLLQTFWKEHQEWDEPLADIHLHQWHAIVDNLSAVSTTVMPRCIGLVCDSAEASHQLLCFTDPSAIAYAAAVYLRTHSSAGVPSTLVFSKNRLAPIRTITLPRLELMGVVLGIRCLAFVREHLQCLNLASIDYLWTDSKCVLMSRDGKVRAAEVQLANGHIIDRPISKLYPLESSTPPTTAKPESERRQSTRLAAIRARERFASPSLY